MSNLFKIERQILDHASRELRLDSERYLLTYSNMDAVIKEVQDKTRFPLFVYQSPRSAMSSYLFDKETHIIIITYLDYQSDYISLKDAVFIER